MDMEELNEVASLLHITSEIATNHPKLVGIQRACLRRLTEIDQEFLGAEAKPTSTPPAELKAAQHTTGQLSLKKQDEDEPIVERRV